MSLNKVTAILLVALLALGVGTVQLWRQRVADHEQIANLQASLEKAVAEARVAAPSSIMEGQITGVEASTVPTGEASALVIPEVTSEARAIAPTARVRLASPENLERARVLDRARAPSQYPGVGQALGLSPEEEDRLYDLLARQQATALQHVADYASSGESRSQYAARIARENEAEVASLLGSKYAQWKEYKDELPSRRQVIDLEAVLRASSTPLSDAQARALIPVLALARKSSLQRGGPQYSPENRQALVDAASGYLTPEQLDAYSQMLDRQQGAGTRSNFGLAPPVPGASAMPP